MQPSGIGPDPTDVAAKRLGAAAIEFGSYWVLSVVVSLVVDGGQMAVNETTSDGSATTTGLWFGATSLAASLIPLAYLAIITVVLRATTGASLGQRAVGLVTVDEQGQPLGAGTCILRALLGIIDGFPYCCFLFLVGGITMFTSKGHRRVADMILNAYVVPKEYLGTPLGPPEVLGMGGAGPYGAPVGPWATAAGSGPGGDAQWDPTRNTWVRWDGTRWWGWDATANQWQPLG